MGRNFLVSNIELGVWLFFSIITGIGTVFSMKYYVKTQLQPVFIIALMNIGASFFSMFFFIGRKFDLSAFFLYALIAAILNLVFNTWLFREIFGPRRSYKFMHLFQIVLGTAAIVITWKSPPVISGNDILFPWEERVAVLGCLLCFIILFIVTVILQDLLFVHVLHSTVETPNTAACAKAHPTMPARCRRYI